VKDIYTPIIIFVIDPLLADVFANASNMSIQETVKSIPCPVNVSKSVKHHLVAKAFEKQQIISRFERKFKHPVREHTFGDYSIGGYGYCLHETEILSLARAEGSP